MKFFDSNPEHKMVKTLSENNKKGGKRQAYSRGQ